MTYSTLRISFAQGKICLCHCRKRIIPMTSLLHSEISEQPRVLGHLLQQERANVERIAQAIRDRQPRYLILAARGSSDNAARYSQYLFGTVNHLTAALA